MCWTSNCHVTVRECSAIFVCSLSAEGNLESEAERPAATHELTRNGDKPDACARSGGMDQIEQHVDRAATDQPTDHVATDRSFRTRAHTNPLQVLCTIMKRFNISLIWPLCVADTS